MIQKPEDGWGETTEARRTEAGLETRRRAGWLNRTDGRRAKGNPPRWQRTQEPKHHSSAAQSRPWTGN